MTLAKPCKRSEDHRASLERGAWWGREESLALLGSLGTGAHQGTQDWMESTDPKAALG